MINMPAPFGHIRGQRMGLSLLVGRFENEVVLSDFLFVLQPFTLSTYWPWN